MPTLNQSVATLRFFFRVTLKRHDILEHTHFIREPRKLPVVLSPEEVSQFFQHIYHLRDRAALMLCYGAGLRISEAVAVKISDIDSSRRLIRIVQGKGKKDGYVMLSIKVSSVSRRTGHREERGVRTPRN